MDYYLINTSFLLFFKYYNIPYPQSLKTTIYSLRVYIQDTLSVSCLLVLQWLSFSMASISTKYITTYWFHPALIHWHGHRARHGLCMLIATITCSMSESHTRLWTMRFQFYNLILFRNSSSSMRNKRGELYIHDQCHVNLRYCLVLHRSHSDTCIFHMSILSLTNYNLLCSIMFRL